MTKREESGLMIAKFMEWGCRDVPGETTIVRDRKGQDKIFYLDELKFDKSWDWLMPVLIKIELGSLITSCVEFKMRSSNNGRLKECVIHGYKNPKEGRFSFKKEAGSLQMAAYMTVVTFIKWYNEQKERIDENG